VGICKGHVKRNSQFPKTLLRTVEIITFYSMIATSDEFESMSVMIIRIDTSICMERFENMRDA
jgi:hypothetical protein